MIYRGKFSGKPRMSRFDKWKHRTCVDSYFAFKDEINRQASEQSFQLADSVEIIFLIEIPKSWSKKKVISMIQQPHQSKPDIDNLVKAVFDALRADDSTIHTLITKKLWALEPSIIINNLTVDIH